MRDWSAIAVKTQLLDKVRTYMKSHKEYVSVSSYVSSLIINDLKRDKK